MTIREQLKIEIDQIDESYLDILYKIIHSFPSNTGLAEVEPDMKKNHHNPLKGCVTFEKDLLTPIDEKWEVAS